MMQCIIGSAARFAPMRPSTPTAVAVKDMNVNLAENWDSPEQQAILDELPALVFLERAGSINVRNPASIYYLP